jgi:UDP-N-acetylmuramoylalanine--D-glutamate ligase
MSNFSSHLLARRRYQIVGLGRNGLPAARALRDMGAYVTVWDDTPSSRATAQAEGLKLHDPAQGLAGFTALILSPGIPHKLPTPHNAATAARTASVPILSDAEILYEAVRASGSKARFVGITGTNGKSTTTSLIAHIVEQAGLPVAAGGNLGPAALALPLLPDTGVYVLEMSSYMLERIASLRFDAAVMLNITPDHLDRHGDMADYAIAKKAIFARQQAGDLAVCGVDDDHSRNLARELAQSPAKLVLISDHAPTGSHADYRPNLWPENGKLHTQDGIRFDLTTAPALPGGHNGENIAASLAVADYLGIDPVLSAAAVQNFPGLPHRQSLVAQTGGIAWIDDSKATNADAASRALACYDHVIWIAGGVAKAGGIESLKAYFHRVTYALLIGQDAPQLAATLRAHDVPHRIVGTMENAVAAAAELAHSQSVPVVLLSPACASFDQYAGFEARGLHFAQLAHERTS